METTQKTSVGYRGDNNVAFHSPQCGRTCYLRFILLDLIQQGPGLEVRVCFLCLITACFCSRSTGVRENR